VRQSSAGSNLLRLANPPDDDLLRPIDLLVDLPPRAHETVDVLLIFADVGVLADHRIALARTTRAQLTWRERPTDLRPER